MNNTNRNKIDLDKMHDGSRKKQQIKMVFENCFNRPQSIGSIARNLNMEKSTASARLNELKKADEIIYRGRAYQMECKGKEKDRWTKITVGLWGAAPVTRVIRTAGRQQKTAV